MSASDSSDLSSPPGTDDEVFTGDAPKATANVSSSSNLSMASTPVEEDEPEPAQTKRSPSPVREEVLADNPDIAFVVMFRSRFSTAFSSKLPHLGPQDIERGIVDSVPSPQVESLLCALLGLVLNRKKLIERGHHGRALEEAIHTQKSQWPSSWAGVSPIAGARTFNSMTPVERLSLLKALIMWSLHSSEIILGLIKENYKQSRVEGDLNQSLSVQPWGFDEFKRRYWLIEGRDDTSFRLYREDKPGQKNVTWRTVAGDIDEIKEVAEKLKDSKSQASRRLGDRILTAIPRFEATDEKRKRREYRQAQKARFTRPEPGYSLYEGRTRGKRMRYTYSEEEEDSDVFPVRRSGRTAGAFDDQPVKPTVTASGRTVKSRYGGEYGEALTTEQRDAAALANGDFAESEGSATGGRTSRSRSSVNGWARNSERDPNYTFDDADDDVDPASDGDEWNAADDEEDGDDQLIGEEGNITDDLADHNKKPKRAGPRWSLVVKLPYDPAALRAHKRRQRAKIEQPTSDAPTPADAGTPSAPQDTGRTTPEQQESSKPVEAAKDENEPDTAVADADSHNQAQSAGVARQVSAAPVVTTQNGIQLEAALHNGHLTPAIAHSPTTTELKAEEVKPATFVVASSHPPSVPETKSPLPMNISEAQPHAELSNGVAKSPGVAVQAPRSPPFSSPPKSSLEVHNAPQVKQSSAENHLQPAATTHQQRDVSNGISPNHVGNGAAPRSPA